MDRPDSLTLFCVNLLLALLIAVYFFGASALLVFALIATPIALGIIITLSLTVSA
ncbi:hypothetical protein [Parvibaculum sp. MBR-TMA-1.3b-4.2]|jgi:CBS-domain-containing membrane protein